MSNSPTPSPKPRCVLVTNDDGPPGDLAPFLLPFLRTLKERLGWNYRVCIPTGQRSWIGKGFYISQDVALSYYNPSTGKTGDTLESVSTRPRSQQNVENGETNHNEEIWTLLDTTPSGCVNIGLTHLYNDSEIDLVISGPNFGRNASSASTLSSGTVGAALDASFLRKKSIALSFAYYRDKTNKTPSHTPTAILRACILSCDIIAHLWNLWHQPNSTVPDSVDLFNVNVPLIIDDTQDGFVPPIRFTRFHRGGYGSLYQPVEQEQKENGKMVFMFKPTLVGGETIPEDSDTW
ncbi:hypothetical protein HK102_000763 [Quaeritorhiza haematococci]|nr:hypothetical protein HK102_000763 [Quaeritorhiza haematococci]